MNINMNEDQQTEKEDNQEKNPFYSFIDKKLYKITISINVLIVVILTIGIAGVYFFNEGKKEQRIESIGGWYEGLGKMICETNKNCEKYVDSKLKDTFIENTFIREEEINIENLQEQFSKELSMIDIFQFNQKDINQWINKCAEHPDIKTATAIRYCAITMTLLDDNLDKQI